MTSFIIAELESLAQIVEPQVAINCIIEDPDDNRILECAVEATADYIISGDEHLLKIRQIEHISIVNPSDFLTILKKQM
ncbi:putative toxin-antitoxin system toxin component, PIN family [candidate division CSSED10-310 bacterium]|uniref:Toxin-antitoxin system toxin component, PIN family n=1 Tax=candidate division CSSED10-310 bacterium TaxID=2855610 RepID=A0ABV6YTT2_UNCC1